MLLVDHREPQEILEKLSVPYKTCQLGVGDYIIGDVAVERKTHDDFFCSVSDNRLWNQLAAMSTTYKNSYLLFEGYTSYRVHNLLNYVCVRYHVLPLFSKNIQQTASILNSMFTLLNKPLPKLLLPHQMRFANPHVSILSQFPGIGIKTARSLLYRFETLFNIFNASRSELREVLNKKQYTSFKTTLTTSHNSRIFAE